MSCVIMDTFLKLFVLCLLHLEYHFALSEYMLNKCQLLCVFLVLCTHMNVFFWYVCLWRRACFTALCHLSVLVCFCLYLMLSNPIPNPERVFYPSRRQLWVCRTEPSLRLAWLVQSFSHTHREFSASTDKWQEWRCGKPAVIKAEFCFLFPQALVPGFSYH